MFTSNGSPALWESPLVRIGIGLLVFAFLFYQWQIMRRRSQRVKFKFKRIIMAELTAFAAFFFFQQKRFPSWEAGAMAIFVALGVSVFFVRAPKRTRRISSSVKRAVIARDLRGERFDPRRHHIDHIVPYSKGGDNSEQNLRVISRTENLKRGAKMPRLRDFMR